MLESNRQRVLRLAAVERKRLGIEGSRRCRIETIPRVEMGVLSPRAIGEIGHRQQADGLLPIAAQRLLRQIVDVDRRGATEFAAVWGGGRGGIVDARPGIFGGTHEWGLYFPTP